MPADSSHFDIVEQPVGDECIDVDSMPVDDLARLARSGNSHAFTVLAAQLRPRVLVAVRRRLGVDFADAEDVMQDSLTKAWKNIQSYDERRPFAAWLYTIAFRTAADYLRRRKRRLHHTRQLPMKTSNTESAQATLCNEEQAANIWSAAKEMLTEQQYIAMWLRYAEEFSVGEVAKTMGMTQVATRVSLHRARAKLHSHLTSEGKCHEE